ncbi:hypothetical protein KBB48_03410, partial [Candidatus Shapirobacteria bacterium]|nr:hypothetical protein [Candidatus Shapirobacteria bacterium]
MPSIDSLWKILEIRLPQENEFTPESMSSLLSNFVQMSHLSFFNRILGKKPTIISLEIVLQKGQIHFYVAIPKDSNNSDTEFFRAQILAQYPSAITKDSQDYLSSFLQGGMSEGSENRKNLFTSQLSLSRPYTYPLKTNRDFRDTDPLTSVLSPLVRSNNAEDFSLYQILLSPPPKNWQSSIISVIQNGIIVDKEKGFRQAHPDKQVFETKIQYPGLLTQINLLSNNSTLLNSLSSSFGIFTSPRGNFIKTSSPNFFNKNKLQKSIFARSFFSGLSNQILNVEELAAMWHFPTALTKLPNIAWGKNLFSDPPENLPVATGLDEAAREKITF